MSQRHTFAYLDFELDIEPGRGRQYAVTVLRSPAGEARGSFQLPFDTLKPENCVLTLPEQQAVIDFGGALFNALFDGEIRSTYDVSVQQARHEGKGLRLKLRVRAPELASLPWEYLFDARQAQFVCLSRTTPIVRYLELQRPVEPLTVVPPLRILGMVANPADLEPLDIVNEKERVERATADLRQRGLAELTWLEGQGWRDLQRAMRHGPWHIFHFIGHGGFDDQAREGMIALTDESGATYPMPASAFAQLLANHSTLRFVMLNSCEGARSSDRDLFSSTAAILIQRGIPSVVAMQFEITDLSAIEFSRSFYEGLADNLPVDAAVVEARNSIKSAFANSIEWGTPVLYMRTPNGKVFDVLPNLEQNRSTSTDGEKQQIHAFDNNDADKIIVKWEQHHLTERQQLFLQSFLDNIGQQALDSKLEFVRRGNRKHLRWQKYKVEVHLSDEEIIELAQLGYVQVFVNDHPPFHYYKQINAEEISSVGQRYCQGKESHMLPFTFVTQSIHKVDETERILGTKVRHTPLDLPEVQAVKVEEVVGYKIRLAYDALGKTPVMIEDTGLYIDAWNGLPGALIKWFVHSVGVEGICQMMYQFENRTALAQTIVATFDGELRIFSGEVSGTVTIAPAGTLGFGWDSIFVPQGDQRTFAEMPPHVKDNYSMRRRAITRLKIFYL